MGLIREYASHQNMAEKMYLRRRKRTHPVPKAFNGKEGNKKLKKDPCKFILY